MSESPTLPKAKGADHPHARDGIASHSDTDAVLEEKISRFEFVDELLSVVE